MTNNQSFTENVNKACTLEVYVKKTTKNITKSWITKDMLKPIKIKNTLYNKFCRTEDNKSKSDLHNKFKKYRNLILFQKKAKTATLKASLKNTKKWS